MTHNMADQMSLDISTAKITDTSSGTGSDHPLTTPSSNISDDVVTCIPAHNKSLADELQVSECETHNTYTISSGPPANDHTYTLYEGTETYEIKTNEVKATEYEISPPTSFEARAACGDGVATPSSKHLEQEIDEACNKTDIQSTEQHTSNIVQRDEENSGILDQQEPQCDKAGNDTCSDSSLGTGFMTAPVDALETAGDPSEMENNSVSVEYTKSENPRSPAKTVRVSRLTANEQTLQMALMMGCETSLLPKTKTHTARIQTRCKRLKEICTQSLYTETNETAMLARTDVNMAVAQTSPQLYQSHVGTEFPERVPLQVQSPLRNTRCTAKQFTKPEKAQSYKAAWNASPRVGSSNYKKVYQPTRNASSPTMPTGKLDFNKQAKSKVASITDHKPNGGQNKIPTQKLDFRDKAKSRVGSLDNAQHVPKGGNVRVYQTKLNFREMASSKIKSLDNINHKAGGGDKQVLFQVVARRSKLFNPAVNPYSADILSTHPQKKRRDRSESLDRTESRTTCSVMMTEPVKLTTPRQTRYNSRVSVLKNCRQVLQPSINHSADF